MVTSMDLLLYPFLNNCSCIILYQHFKLGTWMTDNLSFSLWFLVPKELHLRSPIYTVPDLMTIPRLWALSWWNKPSGVLGKGEDILHMVETLTVGARGQILVANLQRQSSVFFSSWLVRAFPKLFPFLESVQNWCLVWTNRMQQKRHSYASKSRP